LTVMGRDGEIDEEKTQKQGHKQGNDNANVN